MTATDELRRMLDERGVKWCDDSSIYGTRRTVWTANGVTYVAAEVSGRLKVSGYLTPEQAIEATLGPQVQPPAMPEQPPYDVLIDLLRDEWDIDVMWDGLRRFWYVGLTDEGVRKRDEREATLGRETCHDSAGEQMAFFSCSACGATIERKHPRFCFACGRKVVDE